MLKSAKLDSNLRFSAENQRHKSKYAHHECLRFGHCRSSSGAASRSQPKPRAPYVEVAAIDDAIQIAVGRQAGADLTQRLAPDDVVGGVDHTVVVVVALWKGSDG